MIKVFLQITGLSLLLTIIMASHLTAQTVRYSYVTEAGTNKAYTGISIDDAADGYIIRNLNPDGSLQTNEFCSLNSSYETTGWSKASDPDNYFTAKRQGSNIIVNGVIKGRPYKKIEYAGNDPWLEEMNTGIAELVKTGTREFYYYFFNPSDVTMYLRFKGTYMKEEIIYVNGRKIDALNYRITPDGWMAALWSETSWFSKSDGLFVKNEQKMANMSAFVELLSVTSN